MNLKKKVLALASLLAVVLMLSLFFAMSKPDNVESHVADSEMQSTGEPKSSNVDGQSANVGHDESIAIGMVTLGVNSIYESDRDTQEAGIAAAEKLMSTFAGDRSGVLRWETVTLDPTDFISGNIFQSTSFAEEFQITPFSDVTIRAKKTKFIPHPNTGSATWEGELVDGANGTIKLSLMLGRENPITIIRMRADTISYTLMTTGAPNVYVSMETDPVYWRKKPID